MRKANSRRLILESLESRAMLAGNVTVSVTDGVLHVQGDALSNDIDIQQSGAVSAQGLRVEISGRYAGGQLTTTINGEDSVTVEGITQGAVIGLGNGDNYLRIGQTAGTDGGRRPVHFPGRVTICASSGRDRIMLSIYNNTRVTVNAGAGDDIVNLVKSRLYNVFINTDPPAVAGRDPVGGNDNVWMRSISTRGKVVVNSGIGNDEFLADRDNTGFWGSVDLDLGDGNDAATFGIGVNLNGSTTVQTGSGGDSFATAANIRGSFVATLGSGSDLLYCRGFSTTVLDITLDDGNDNAIVFSELLAGLKLDGGVGTDRLTQHSSNPDGEESFTRFEGSE